MTETTDDSSEKLDEKESKTVKLAIDEEKYDTNWCDMPAEIKLMCIGTMDFEMRCQLRLTARAENQLVDSLRYKFDQLALRHESLYLYLHATHEAYGTLANFEKKFEYALKHCDFDEIRFWSANLLHGFNFDKLDTVLQPKTIYWSETSDFNTFLQFFKVCWNEVKAITVMRFAHDSSFEQFFAISSVFNAAKLIISTYRHSQATEFIHLIEKWIEIGAQAGTELCIVGVLLELPPLFDHFQDRQIFREESTMTMTSKMRIRTDNPEKHILMEFSGASCISLRVTVIPSDRITQFEINW